MRSPYCGNIKNKFFGYIPQYDDNGVMKPPHPKDNPQYIVQPYVKDIENRLESVVPKSFTGAGALQSFFEVPDSEIIKAWALWTDTIGCEVCHVKNIPPHENHSFYI
jgi:hypothetical protein